MDSINKIPNINNNTAFLCNNSCYLNTDGLKYNSKSNIQFTIPNKDSNMSAPSLHINDKKNNIFIKFNDVNMRETIYYFLQLSFNKANDGPNGTNKLYLSMIFKNSSKREIILKIELKRTNKVINTNLNTLLTKAFNNPTSSLNEETILNLQSFLPTNNSFYFTTITPDVLMILFENSILINEVNYNKLIENIHNVASTNDVLTSPLFYNEGSEPESSQICTSTSDAINNIIKNNKSKEKIIEKPVVKSEVKPTDKPEVKSEEKPEIKPVDKPVRELKTTDTTKKTNILNRIELIVAIISIIVIPIVIIKYKLFNSTNVYYLLILLFSISFINMILTSINIHKKENEIPIIIIFILNIVSILILISITIIVYFKKR